MINIEKFDSNLLKINKKSYKSVGIYYIGYITIKRISDYENINNVYSVCIMCIVLIKQKDTLNAIPLEKLIEINT